MRDISQIDAADARTICEVAGRPATRFVAIKTAEQQDLSAWHKMRERKVKERTSIADQASGFLMEQGIVVKRGLIHIRSFLPIAVNDLKNVLSMQARDYLSDLYSELVACDKLIEKYEKRIIAFAKNDEACERLQKTPSVLDQ